MNYYRRYVGSYLKKTISLTMAEDGAYTRLLDAYYAEEKPLDPAKVNQVARAQTPAERKAVATVVGAYFHLGADGLLHNEKADEELGIAIPKLERLREVARENGKKGGRKKTKSGSDKEPKPEPDPVPKSKQPSAVSHQPKAKPPSEERSPERETGEPPPTAGALALAEQAGETPAAVLAAICTANGIRATAFHPLVVDWAHDGVTPERLKAAIATAMQRPGKDKPGSIPLSYLDPIVHDAAKPKAKPWKSDDNEAEALCRNLGIKGAKVGEDRAVWHQRIETALAEQVRSRVA